VSEPSADQRALAIREPPARLRLASSVASLQRGQSLLLDHRGRAISERTLNLLAFGVLAVLVPYVVVTASYVQLAVTGGVFVFMRVLGRQMRRLHALIAQYRDDEAWELAKRLERASKRPGTHLVYLLGLIAWRRGDMIAAATYTEQAMIRTRRSIPRTWHWVHRYHHAHMRLELDGAAAEPLVTALTGGPTGEYFRHEANYTQALLAFRLADHTRLPGDEVLYDWAKLALGSNIEGRTVGLLAWAFDQRGDAEMSAYLLGEVRSRLLGGEVTSRNTSPALWEWLGPRLPPPETDETAT
jgi:hypothetical protein